MYEYCRAFHQSPEEYRKVDEQEVDILLTIHQVKQESRIESLGAIGAMLGGIE